VGGGGLAQEGELADAGLAPGGPEVDHHRAAAQGGQVDLAAVEAREAQGRGRGAGRVGLGGGRDRGRRGPDLQLGDRLAAAGAKVTGLELESDRSYVSYKTYETEQTVTTRWLVDASGRAALLARKLGNFRQNTEHPINAVWARFTGVKDWDSYEWREKFRDYANACRTSRNWATNHLMGHGWWCWIIPLRGGDVSAGIVYDSRIFKLAEGPSLSERLRAHLLSHPVGAEIFGGAQIIEGDVHAYSALPYSSAKVCGESWATVGDAAGFIDPLYSPGLDFCSYTSHFVADLLAPYVNFLRFVASIAYMCPTPSPCSGCR
jgi:hypothetical protein